MNKGEAQEKTCYIILQNVTQEIFEKVWESSDGKQEHICMRGTEMWKITYDTEKLMEL